MYCERWGTLKDVNMNITSVQYHSAVNDNLNLTTVNLEHDGEC